MNKPIKTTFFILLVLMSCGKGYITDCDSCTDEIPERIYLDIYISRDFAFPANTLITIYEGAMEDSLVFERFVTNTQLFETEVMLFKDYSVTAEYVLDGIRYTAVDAARPELRYDQSNCDIPCYYVFNNIIDVRLRYRN